jgi:alpha-glucosidase
VPGSTYELYRSALRLRREHNLGSARLSWVDTPADVLAFRSGRLLVMTNFGDQPAELPVGARVLLSSEPLDSDGRIPTDVTVWAL